MARLTLLCFGPFCATLAGRSLTNLARSPKMQSLLAYLALEKQRIHTRDALATLLWPDEPERTARQNLRQVLYQLRLLLGEAPDVAPPTAAFLLITHDTVQFNPASDYSLDVATFLAHLAQQQRAQAVEIYQDELLTGLTSESRLFEEWLLLKREQFHIQALDALAYLTQQALTQADYPQVQTYAWRQLALDPWREEAHRHLMQALAAVGERSAALAQYEICRRALAEGLGVEPDAETQVLVAKIRSVESGTHARPQGPAALTASTPLNPSTQAVIPAEASPESRTPHSALRTRTDWGEAPDVVTFHGRQAELTTLQHWLVDERCRLVLVMGMGGIGKTTLTARVAMQAAEQFEFVIWRSLLNAPPLPEILYTWLHFLAGQEPVRLPEKLDSQLALLFDYLRQHRCLLVLDNAESIMQAADELEAHAGLYRLGYEAYGQLFKRIGESQHQSCLLLTSREAPQDVTRLERIMPLVRMLPLAGLPHAAGHALLQMQGLQGASAATQAIIDHYSGNPLALLLVADTIQELFDGDVTLFLNTEDLIFDDIRAVLDQQFARLSPLEREILLWLAIEREPVSAQTLAENIRRPLPKGALVEALNSLRRRSLLEKSSPSEADRSGQQAGFTLQNVVTEYITNYLIEQVTQEVLHAKPALLKRHSLLKAQAKEFVRQSQMRVILQPIRERLQAQLGPAALERQIQTLLALLREAADAQSGYAGGNLVNLLLHLRADLSRYDFAHLPIWRACLQGEQLANVNFAHSDLWGSSFTDAFSAITALGFSPDGAVLVGGTVHGELRFWRVTDGQALGLWQGHTNEVWSLTFSPDGSLLASCSDDALIQLWDLRASNGLSGSEGRLLHTLRGHTEGVWRLSFSPDGLILASASADHTVRLWDVATGRLLHTLVGHTKGVRAVAFHPKLHYLLVSGGEDGKIVLWHGETGELLAELSEQTTMIWSLVFSPNGQFMASGGDEHTVRLWTWSHSANPAAWVSVPQILSGHTGRVVSLAFSPDSALLASSSTDQTLRLWEIGAPAQMRMTWQGHTDAVNAVAFSPDGQTVASGSADQTVRLWAVKTGQVLQRWQGHTQGVISVALAPDGCWLATAHQDHKVRLWDLATQRLVTVLGGHRKEVEAVAFSPDSALLASSSADHTVRLWETTTGKLRHVLLGHTALVRTVVFSPDGTCLMSGSSDWCIRFWDVRTGALQQSVSHPRASIWSVACSADGASLAAACTNDALYVWHLRQPNGQNGNPLVLHGHTTWVTTVAFSPDNRLLASGSGDQTIRLWEAHTGELQQILTGHQDWVYGVAFSPVRPETPGGSVLLASCSADKTICIWDSRHGQLLTRLYGHTNAIRSLAFSADGSILASGSIDETVKLWDMRSGVCFCTLRAPGPYAGLNILGATGISEAQKAALRALGAVEQ